MGTVPATGQLVEATFSDGEAFSETAVASRGRCHIKHLTATTATMPPYRFRRHRRPVSRVLRKTRGLNAENRIG